ncbi:hypothetical protein HRbin22_01782 [Candidatus Thermoflexus japonica]|uniref:Uncharacterized protein n=1 Tax=Candidatus Thermoflexus japonica TaxID=2035417 RepID=A0A2H5Y7V9_9CHLR|nr:hypothetical protein HRbin22_01782 [Candidatus Thermoflexus japonica]
MEMKRRGGNKKARRRAGEEIEAVATVPPPV